MLLNTMSVLQKSCDLTFSYTDLFFFVWCKCNRHRHSRLYICSSSCFDFLCILLSHCSRRCSYCTRPCLQLQRLHTNIHNEGKKHVIDF